MKIKFFCFNIKYTGREKVISVTGPGGLRNFIDPTYREFYGKGYTDTLDANTAPNNLLIELNISELDQANLDEYYDALKKEIEGKVGLTVKSFSYSIIS